MTKKILTVSLAVLLCSGVLLAQRGMFERRPGSEADSATAPVDQLKAYLNLTDQQLQSLKSVQSAYRDAAGPTLQQIRETSQALREAMQQNDSANVAKYQAALEALQKDLQSLRSQYKEQAQSVLTNEQKGKLTVLQKALELMPVAQQAGSLNLVDMPAGGGPGFGGPGMRGGRGPGERMP